MPSSAEEVQIIAGEPQTTPPEVAAGTHVQLVHEFRHISGFTWAGVADAFGISERAIFDWAAGKPISEKNHHRLGKAVAVLHFIDCGSCAENRNLLLSDAGNGKTFLDLLKENQFEKIKTLAGKGVGRPAPSRELTKDAERFNMPEHFGRAMIMAAESIAEGIDIDAEIIPVKPPKIRRAKARPMKA